MSIHQNQLAEQKKEINIGKIEEENLAVNVPLMQPEPVQVGENKVVIKPAIQEPNPKIAKAQDILDQRWQSTVEYSVGFDTYYRKTQTQDGKPGITKLFRDFEKENSTEWGKLDAQKQKEKKDGEETLLEYNKDCVMDIWVDADTMKTLTKEKLAEQWKAFGFEKVPEGEIPSERKLASISKKFMENKLVESEEYWKFRETLKGDQYTGESLQMIRKLGLWDQYYLFRLTKLFYEYGRMKKDVEDEEAIDLQIIEEQKAQANAEGAPQANAPITAEMREQFKKNRKQTAKEGADEAFKTVKDKAGNTSREIFPTGAYDNVAIYAARLFGDDDDDALRLFEDLNKKGEDSEVDQRFANAVEKLMVSLLFFDVKLLEKDPLELYQDHEAYIQFKQVSAIAKSLKESSSAGDALFKQYTDILKSRKAKTDFDKVKIDFIIRRINLFSTKADDLEDFINKTKDKVQELIEKEPEGEAGSLSLDDEIKNKMKSDIKDRKKDELENRNELSRNRMAANLERFNPRAINDARRLAVKKATVYGNYAKKQKEASVSISDREAKMAQEHSTLYEKGLMSSRLLDCQKTVRGKAAKNRRALSLECRSLVKEEELNALSVFFSDNTDARHAVKKDAQNTLLVRRFAKDRDVVMDTLTEKIMSMTLDNISLSTDEDMLNSAQKLEELSQMISAYNTLLKGDENYIGRLKGIKGKGDGKSLYELLEGKMAEFTTVTEYYRARKLLLTNPYYLSHENSELGVIYEDSASEEQKEVSRLLYLSGELAKRIHTKFAGRGIGDAPKLPQFRNEVNADKYFNCKSMMQRVSSLISQKGTDADLTALEAKFAQRRYADGRMDLKLLTKENINKLMAELNSFSQKYNVSLDDIVADKENANAVLAQMSPSLREIFKIHKMKNNYDYYEKVAAGNSGSKLGQLYEEYTHRRIGKAKKDSGKDLDFSFECSTTLIRLKQDLISMAQSEGLSDDEAMEILEGLTVSNWNDCDMTDEKQAAAAKDHYYKSLARVYKMYYNISMRYLNTHGLLLTQIPPLMQAIVMPQHFSQMRVRTGSHLVGDIIDKGTMEIEGQKVNLFDALVAKGYLTDEFANGFKEIYGYVMQTQSDQADLPRQINYTFVGGGEDQELAAYSWEFSNQHRGVIQKFGPRLSEKEELGMWNEIRQAKGFPADFYKEAENISKDTMIREKEEVYTLGRLESYITSLESVDKGGHSSAYKAMSAKLGRLQVKLSGLNGRDGRLVQPDDLFQLRELYKEAIDSCVFYLGKKNRNHKNELYRRRYDIVEELQHVLEKDYDRIGSKDCDRIHKLDELLLEAREITFEGRDAVEQTDGQWHERQIFHTTDGQKDMKMVFTAHSTLLSEKDALKNRYSDFGSNRDGATQFPALADIAGRQGNRALLDKFFDDPEISEYMEHLLDENPQQPVTEQMRARFADKFQRFLGLLWTENQTDFVKKYPNRFAPTGDKTLPALYRAFTSVPGNKEKLMADLETIGKEYSKAHIRIIKHKSAGINIGTNLNRRNVAAYVLAREIGTKKVIAESQLAKVKLPGGEEQQGTVTEFIDGLSVREVRAGIADGTIILEDEAELIRQLSDIQVTDYLCGNINRNMDSLKVELADTGQMKDGKPVRKIKRVVGVGNDLSFGQLDAKNLTNYRGCLTPPELMNLIHADTANSIMTLDKSRLFIKLGTTVSEAEKEAMWTRVIHMKKMIRDAQAGKSSLAILDNEKMKDVRLADLQKANEQANNHANVNLFYNFCAYSNVADVQNEQKIQRDAQGKEIPRRMNVSEQRIDLTMSNVNEGTNILSDHGYDLSVSFFGKKQAAQRNMLSTQEGKQQFLTNVLMAANEFNENILKLFSGVSDNDNFGFANELNPQATLFATEYAKSHGIKNGIIDLFYINDKPAAEVFRNLDELTNIMADVMPQGMSMEARRDLLACAYLMTVISMGDKQVTIANYQKSADGERDELVITDLNVVRSAGRRDAQLPPEVTKNNEKTGNGKKITAQRKSRRRRFDAIAASMNNRIARRP